VAEVLSEQQLVVLLELAEVVVGAMGKLVLEPVLREPTVLVAVVAVALEQVTQVATGLSLSGTSNDVRGTHC
jgi:hypothetical protein